LNITGPRGDGGLSGAPGRRLIRLPVRLLFPGGHPWTEVYGGHRDRTPAGVQEIRMAEEIVRLEVNEHCATESVAQLIKEKQTISDIGCDNNDHFRVNFLQRIQYSLQRNLCADRGETRLPALGIFAAIFGAEFEGQMFTHQRQFQLTATPLQISLFLQAIPNVRNVGRKVKI
jgi:hypothetical protein